MGSRQRRFHKLFPSRCCMAQKLALCLTKGSHLSWAAPVVQQFLWWWGLSVSWAEMRADLILPQQSWLSAQPRMPPQYLGTQGNSTATSPPSASPSTSPISARFIKVTKTLRAEKWHIFSLRQPNLPSHTETRQEGEAGQAPGRKGKQAQHGSSINLKGPSSRAYTRSMPPQHHQNNRS